jgi:hypothetical protein
MWGPSGLLGGEFYLTDNIGIMGAAGLSYNIISSDSSSLLEMPKLPFALDGGLTFRF